MLQCTRSKKTTPLACTLSPANALENERANDCALHDGIHTLWFMQSLCQLTSHWQSQRLVYFSFCFCFSKKCPFLPSVVLLPQDQVNAVVRHAGGKDQAQVVAPVQAVQPVRFSGQKAGAPLGLPVFRQRPAADHFLCPQVHYVQEVVIKQESKNVTEAQQGKVCKLGRFDNPATRNHRGQWGESGMSDT